MALTLNLYEMKNTNHNLNVAAHRQQYWKISACIVFTAMVLALLNSCSLDTLVDESDKTVPRASAPGDVVGKVTVGYQGWFAAIGDGSPINAWWHWTQNWSQTPSSSNNGIKSWPDTREYTTTYATGWSNLNNGQQAKLFSSFVRRRGDSTVSALG